MTVEELKRYDWTKRKPSSSRYREQVIIRGSDVQVGGATYIIIGRSKVRPLTHWRLQPVSPKRMRGEKLIMIELTTEEILEARAIPLARRLFRSRFPLS